MAPIATADQQQSKELAKKNNNNKRMAEKSNSGYLFPNLCCGGCLEKISKKNQNVRLALKQYWHDDCFRCSICDCHLCDWYFESNQKKVILCRNDYLELYRNHCQQCGEILSGPFMAADEHKFHPECFMCCECGDHIGLHIEYILVERSKIYDRKCFEGKKAPHSIHFIKVNLQQNNLLPIKLCVEQTQGKTSKMLIESDIKISEIDGNININQKHIGDKLLEVNGISTRNVSIDSISDIVFNSEKTIQLTIEHNLNQKPRSDNIYQKQNERLYKKKSEIGISKVTPRYKAPNNFKAKERSSSMSTLVGSTSTTTNELYDLSRTRSFRVEGKSQKIFRASDLVQGELLGKGFFGQVYKITEKNSGEVMVLKELYRVDEDAQKNFLKEVAVLKSLSHPNVLRFIGVLYKNSKLHLITEFVPRTLNEIIHNFNTLLPHSQRISFAKDIATGMNYLHNNNIIHRDLNSYNCLVREDMSVIVADFGLARIISQPPRYRTTSKILSKLQSSKKIRHRKQRYTIVGNPYWMAPEMMKGNKYDEKVDIFSFGIVICELIGRISADPDFLPRSSDFGLDHKVFIEKFCDSCPETFYLTAFVCCDLNPDKRPPFSLVKNWLMNLCKFVPNCFKEVHNYVLNNNIDLPVIYKEVTEIQSNNSEDVDHALLNTTTKTQLFRCDFSETGERLRNSFRARRHKKSVQSKKVTKNEEDNILLCDTSESEPLSLIEISNEATKAISNVEHTLNKVSKKLENDRRLKLDAFVIKIEDNIFSMDGVKKLENLSDIDSSCDTSVNIIDSSLSWDNYNNDSKSLEYNSDASLIEKTKNIPKASLNLNSNKNVSISNKISKDKEINIKKNNLVKGPEIRNINIGYDIEKINKLNEIKLSKIKNHSGILESVQKKNYIKSKEQIKKKTSLKTNSVPKSYNSEKITISEKMTESARAKIKEKVQTKPFKITMLTSTQNIQEKSKLKTLTIKTKKHMLQSSQK